MHNYSILIVEDDVVTRQCLRNFLNEMGHTIANMASSAEECFECIEKDSPDLVLMDILLEGDMDGREAATRITEQHDLPVIFLTSLSAEEAINDKDSQAACYIQKPIHKSDLAANIQLAIMNHRMEQRIRESERRYRSLFDNAVAGIYQATPDGRVTHANHSFARILGYDSPTEAVETLRDIGMQYYEAPGRWSQLLERLQQDKELVRIRSEVLGRDGDLIWVSEHLRAIPDDSGEIDVIVGVVLDITELKEAEENLRVTFNLLEQTVNSLPDPLVLTDLEQNVILHNHSFTNLFSPDTSLDGKALSEILPHQANTCCQQAFGEFSSAPDAPVEASFPEGSSGVTISPYNNPQGELIGALFLFHGTEFH